MMDCSRREFLKMTGALASSTLVPAVIAKTVSSELSIPAPPQDAGPADYTIRIATTAVEIARNRIFSATTYMGPTWRDR